MIILGCPHLVLPHLGGNNGLSFGDLMELFHHILGFDPVPLLIGKGFGCLPVRDLPQPGLSLAFQRAQPLFLEHAVELLQSGFAVSHDGDGNGNVFTDGGGIDIDMDDLGI